MKTVNDILTTAFTKLADDHPTTTIYKGKHPTFTDQDPAPSKFIAINSLPVLTDYVEETVINVNVHADEIGPGRPDFDTLDTLAKSAITSLDEYVSDGVEFYYQQHKQETSHLTGKDFINIRFEVNAQNS